MPFNLNNVISTPVTSGTNWIRPSDWPVITDTANEVQFLFADTAQAKISLQITYSGTNPIIDWGDGTTTSVTASGSGYWNKTYTKGTGTSCSRGYTTFKIRVYGPIAGATTLTTVRPLLDPSTSFGVINSNYVVGLLEAYYGNGTQAGGLNSYFTSTTSGPNSAQAFTLLEYVKMPATLNSGVNHSYSFSQCSSLAVVVMPTSSPGSTTWTSTFAGCSRLLSIDFPDDTIPTRLDTIFQNCYNLKQAHLPDLSAVTNMANAFDGCSSLNDIVVPAIGNSMINMSSMFSLCVRLTSVTFLGLPTSSISVSMNSAFNSCPKLESVIFPSSVSSNPTYDLQAAFSGCYTLRTFTLPSGFRCSNYQTTFNACYQLQYCNIVGNNNQPVTSFNQTFNNCSNLKEVYLPELDVAVSNFAPTNMFNACNSLETLVVPSANSNKWTTLASVLPPYLKSLTITNLSNVTQIGITNFAYLADLVFPASMPALAIISISNCRNLKTITLPTTTGTLTSLQITGNPVLEVINNMPTSAPSITTFNNSFTNNYSLKSIVLPATASSSAQYTSTFQNCFALESVTFPNTQNTTAGAYNMPNCFSNCGSLATIINFDKTQSANATALLNFSSTGMNLVPGLTFSARLSALLLNGSSTTALNRITSLRLLSTLTGQWTGSSPQINVSNTRIGYTALVQLFNDIASSGTYTSKTINITSCDGASSLTAADRLILTSRGWTITG